MGFDTPATAAGDLARTPFAHLLVYAVDRRLTGALFISEPPSAGAAPVEHVVRFARGTPVKVRLGDAFAPLGELLIEAGALSRETLADALATQGLLGDVLLLAGCVDRHRLEAVCEKQFQMRMTRLFALPEGATFRYCDGHIELLDYGGDPASVDALTILWAGLKAHGGPCGVVDTTLSRLGDLPLRIHPQATVSRLALTDDEMRVIDHLHWRPERLAALAKRELLAQDRLRQLVYALAITRQLDLGSSATPVGSLEARRPPSGSTSSTSVGRVQLKPTTHRMGAAAPDASGDGERSSKPVTGRRPIMTPLSTQRMRDELPTLHDAEAPAMGGEKISTTATPNRATRDVRQTAKSARDPQAPTPVRPASVEVIAGDATLSGRVPERTIPGAESSPAPADDGPSARRDLSATALFELAGSRLLARDLDGAQDACARAREADPTSEEIAVLFTWIRSQRAGADLKGLTIELDELLSASPDHRNARYYRAILRKRLGDNTGAVRDLRLLQKQSPTDAEVLAALEALEEPAAKPRSGLLGWLFKR